MIANSDSIWYASYGSNLQKERFLCYIRGGKPKGREDTYKGCKDKTLPALDEKLYINRRLYFAKKSRGWKLGGVGFISNSIDDSARTLARMYLITKE